MPNAKFPLSSADAAYLADLAREKNQALALLDQCAALLADVPTDNAFLAYVPLNLDGGRKTVVHRFVAQVVRVLADHYQCRLDIEALLREQQDWTVDAILDRAVQQLGGRSAAQAARDHIRQDVLRRSHVPWVQRGRTVTIPGFLVFIESAWARDVALPTGQLTPLITALEEWATGALYADLERWEMAYPGHGGQPPHVWFTTHPTPLAGVFLRYFKNGRIDITFASAALAQDFLHVYGPPIDESAEGVAGVPA